MKLGQHRPDLTYAAKMIALACASVPAFIFGCERNEDTGFATWYWPTLALFGLIGTVWSLGYWLLMGNDVSNEYVRQQKCRTCGNIPESKIQGSSIKLTCQCGTKYRPSAWRGAPSIGDY